MDVADFDGRSEPLPDDADEDEPLEDAVSPDVEDDADEDEDDDLSSDDVEDPLSPPDPPSFDVEALEPLEPSDDESSDLGRDVPGLAVARRSFLAQPVPLKWIAGAAKAFFTGPPPHSGHVVGSSAWTPRRTSNRLPQFAQS